jgi:tRNA 5-methylaminomethyl-2-thiouridine biosynthesis bifunctional protein
MAEPDASAFLPAAGLPAAWASQNAWRCLDTAFGSGQQFFKAWDAWRLDDRRPRILHYVGLCAEAPKPGAIRQAAASEPGLNGVVGSLLQQSEDLRPGFHRLSLEGGHLLLTLCIGELSKLLRQQRFQADTLLLDPDPSLDTSDGRWDLWRVKALARLARRGAGLTLRGHTATLLRPALQQCGFVLPDEVASEPVAVIRAEFQPAWVLKNSRQQAFASAVPVTRCVVVGAGLAGASVAAALARRGWQVSVLDKAATPAQGASGLPAGLVVPHVSVDDCSLSRLSRSGVQMVLQQAQALLRSGADWDSTGVLQRFPGGEGDSPKAPALWHTQAGWVKPAALVQAWLAQPGVRFLGDCSVAGLKRQGGLWQVIGDDGRVIAAAERVVLANANGVLPLLAACGNTDAGWTSGTTWPILRSVHGQVTWALHADSPPVALAAMPAFPVNGAGSLLPQVPLKEGMAWLAGATYQPDDEPDPGTQSHHAANLSRLARLLPDLAAPLATMVAAIELQAWRGSRCVSADRLPLLGPLNGDADQSLWLCAAMGSRGLSLAVLCAEMLAARWGAEPLPVDAALARTLDADRGRPNAL